MNSSVTFVDVSGASLVIGLHQIIGLWEDDADPKRTTLCLEDTQVTVDEPYEALMDRLSHLPS